MDGPNQQHVHPRQEGERSIWNHGGQYTLYEYGPDCQLLKAEKREAGEVFAFAHDDQVGSLRVGADSDRDLGFVRFGWRDCLPP